MTLDEAIIHAEKAAKRNEEYAKIHAHGDEFEQEDAFKCEKCAKEHLQLVEWLKDYKRLLEQESCEDCISRQAAIAAADYADYTGLAIEDVKKVTDEIIKGLKQLPPVTPAEKVGRWISTETKGVRYAFWCRYKCSLCGELSDRKNFCPNCGAKMQEVEE